jgi:thioesterase domain-containing protein/acyl carrier protein
VKVRGFRIEPGEIENAISEMAGVRDRIVVARKDLPSDKQLVAYVVPAAFDPEKDLDEVDRFSRSLKDHLARRLPEYMRPSYTVLMRELPLNPNGKVDKKVLPLPQARPVRMQAAHVAPRDETERRLTAIWSKVLGVSDIGLHDDFFELGGHSLIGLQLLTQVEQQFGVALPLKELFVMPTVAKMADALRTNVDPVEWTNLQAIQPEGSLPPMICVQGDEGNYFLPKYMGKDQPFYGIFHQGEDGHPMRWTTVKSMAGHYISELRSARPHGPYFLAGYSFGGIIAYEMAQHLKAAGEEVPVLVIFDMYDPVEYRKVSQREVPWHAYFKERLVKRISQYYFDRGRPLPTRFRHNYIIGVYDEAIRTYEPEPFHGPITLMRTRGSTGPHDMGWTKWASGGVEIRMVPGDHYNMIKEPHVRALAAQLNDVVRKSMQRMKAAAMQG